jgi:hypothetical protein
MCWYVFGKELLCNSEPPPPEPQYHVSSYHIGRRCAVLSALYSASHDFGNNLSRRRRATDSNCDNTACKVATPQRHLACSRNRQPLATGAITPRHSRQSFHPQSPFTAATKRGTKAGFYAEWRWPSWARHGMAPTPPTANTKDHEARRPAPVDQPSARARPRQISPISQTWRTGSCALRCHPAAAECRLHAVMRIRHNQRAKYMRVGNPPQSATADSEMIIAHHCHYSNSQAHHAQAGLVEKDRQPPRESNMSRNFP